MEERFGEAKIESFGLEVDGMGVVGRDIVAFWWVVRMGSSARK